MSTLKDPPDHQATLRIGAITPGIPDTGPAIPTSLSRKGSIRRPPRAVTTEPIHEEGLIRPRQQALQEHRLQVGPLQRAQVCVNAMCYFFQRRII